MRTYSFCPVCGAGNLTAGTREVPPADLLLCANCGFHFWQNSKPAVGALIPRKLGSAWHVLLTRRGIEPYKGMWDAPGGFLGNGELPQDGLRRELREELGVELSRPRFLVAEVDQYLREDVAEQARFVLSLFYTCEIPADAVLQPADDIVEAVWFPLDSPPSDLAFEANHKALDHLREWLRTTGERLL